MKKYKIIRINVETHQKLIKKQEKMNSVYNKITGKHKKIPLTKVIDITATSPLYLGDDELLKTFKKRKYKI